MVIDLTSPEGRFEPDVRAITTIIESIGRAETLRQQRLLNTSIINVLQSGGTPDQIEAGLINAALQAQTPQFDTGLAGALQKFGSGFARPPGADITSALATRALKPKKTASIADQRAAEAARTGAKPGTAEFERIASGPAKGKEIGPTDQTKLEKNLARDVKILQNEKITSAVKRAAKRRIRANEIAPNITPDTEDYSEFLDKSLREKFKPGPGFKFGKSTDKRFGKKAYISGLKKAKDNFLAQGINEASVEADFNNWWDSKVAEEADQTLQKFESRDNFGRATKGKAITSDSVRLQSAPDVRLDGIWGQLTIDQRKSILKKLDENPANIEEIIARIQSADIR